MNKKVIDLNENLKRKTKTPNILIFLIKLVLRFYLNATCACRIWFMCVSHTHTYNKRVNSVLTRGLKLLQYVCEAHTHNIL